MCRVYAARIITLMTDMKLRRDHTAEEFITHSMRQPRSASEPKLTVARFQPRAAPLPAGIELSDIDLRPVPLLRFEIHTVY